PPSAKGTPSRRPPGRVWRPARKTQLRRPRPPTRVRLSAVGPARGEETMSNPARVLRWTALRDKKAALKEVSESFLIHRHDLSIATQDNYRLQFRLYDMCVSAQLGRPT